MALRDIPFDERKRRAKHLTNSTELIAAALATCFSATLAAELQAVGLRAQTIKTASTIALQLARETWVVTAATLEVVAVVPCAAPGDFIEAAVTAKLTCPICRLLNMLNTDIAMSAKLES
jgi:organic hydroperoxide reductase OsmC/OhrA